MTEEQLNEIWDANALGEGDHHPGWRASERADIDILRSDGGRIWLRKSNEGTGDKPGKWEEMQTLASNL